MLSGAETVLTNGTDGGGEELTGQGTVNQGTDRTGEGEKWEDLNPADFPQIPVEVVQNLNKKAVTQFQNKVRQITDSNKPYREKAEKLERLAQVYEQKVGEWMDDPQRFMSFHKEKRPDYWRSQPTGGDLTDTDKQAVSVLLNALRKEGKVLTQDDIAPFVQYIQQLKARSDADNLDKAQEELNAHESWCKEKGLPWDDDIAQDCIALIQSGRYKTLKGAYERVMKPVIDKTNQLNLKQKKSNLTGQPSGGKEAQRTNLSLRQIIEENMGDSE